MRDGQSAGIDRIADDLSHFPLNYFRQSNPSPPSPMELDLSSIGEQRPTRQDEILRGVAAQFQTPGLRETMLASVECESGGSDRRRIAVVESQRLHRPMVEAPRVLRRRSERLAVEQRLLIDERRSPGLTTIGGGEKRREELAKWPRICRMLAADVQGQEPTAMEVDDVSTLDAFRRAKAIRRRLALLNAG